MRKLKIFIFILISFAALAYVLLNKEKKLDDMYYAFPGPAGLIEVAIPNKITKNKDCAKLRDWMQTQTPPDLIMEMLVLLCVVYID